MPLAFHSAALSHVGHVRELNEDAYCALPQQGIWCVADGMGGHDAGEVASSMLASAVAGLVAGADLQASVASLRDAILQVNHTLSEEQTVGLQNSLMGSTVIALVIADAECACLWAGDSRLYLYRDTSLYQMSRDHSVVQELLDQGIIAADEAGHHPQRHVITRAVGVDAELELELITFGLQSGDVLLLCSDGLYSELNPDQIMAALAIDGSSDTRARLLVEQVLQGQARDNVTVNVISMQAS